MPRAQCRCGQALEIPDEGPDRIVCPSCSARIRVRRDPLRPADDDGYLRFLCPCGRRLKVKAEGAPELGKCPDCGRVVPVVASSSGSAFGRSPAQPDGSRTEELSADDLAMLEQWGQRFPAPEGGLKARATDEGGGPSAVKIEAGLRVCPRCGKPIHLGASACRECGTTVAKR